MQIFSWVLLFIIAYIIISSGDNKTRFMRLLLLNLVMCIHFESGYFIAVNGFELDYDQVTSVVTLLFGVLSLNGKIKLDLLKRIAMYIFVVMIGVIGIIILPYKYKIVTGESINYDSVISGITDLNYISLDMGVVSGIVFVLIFSIILICAWQIMKEEDYCFLINKTAFYCKLVLLYGILEAIVTYIFKSSICRSVIDIVFGRGRSTFSTLILRENGFMLQGFTREASHYAFSLFISIIIIYTSNKLKFKRGYFWYITYVLISILSFSLSPVLYFGGLLILLALIKIKMNPQDAMKKLLKLLYGFLGVGLILCLGYYIIELTYQNSDNYLVERLGDFFSSIKIIGGNYGMSLFSNYQYRSSNMIRLYSIVNTFKLLMNRPLFGFGIGTITCHGSTAMFLGDVGILGLYMWYKFVSYVPDRGCFSKIDYLLYRITIIVYIVINIFSSKYLIPFNSVVVIIYIVCAKYLFGNQCNLVKRKEN